MEIHSVPTGQSDHVCLLDVNYAREYLSSCRVTWQLPDGIDINTCVTFDRGLFVGSSGISTKDNV